MESIWLKTLPVWKKQQRRPLARSVHFFRDWYIKVSFSVKVSPLFLILESLSCMHNFFIGRWKSEGDCYHKVKQRLCPFRIKWPQTWTRPFLCSYISIERSRHFLWLVQQNWTIFSNETSGKSGFHFKFSSFVLYFHWYFKRSFQTGVLFNVMFHNKL